MGDWESGREAQVSFRALRYRSSELIYLRTREQGILILSGGLTIHTFADFSAFSEDSAKPIYKEFSEALLDAAQQPQVCKWFPRLCSSDAITFLPQERLKDTLIAVTKHKGFRVAHPREEHFIPLYVAAGAGEGGDTRIVAGIYGAPTFAFGL